MKAYTYPSGKVAIIASGLQDEICSLVRIHRKLKKWNVNELWKN